MLAPANNKFAESPSPHSMGLLNDMTIPNPGWDSMANLSRDKLWSGASPQTGMGTLSMDGTGLLGTGLFSGDFTTWGIPEFIASLFGAYAFYAMFHQTKQTKYRLEQSAHKRRKSRAASYRAKAKKLEEREVGGIF